MQAIIEALQTPGLVDGLISLQANVPPEVQPDFNGPGSGIARQVTSWVLGLVLSLAVLALIGCGAMIVFKGFGNQAVQQFGAKNIIWAFIGVIFLGSVFSIFAFTVGLDLGL